MSKNPLTREQQELLDLLSSELQDQLDFSLNNSTQVSCDKERLTELAELSLSFISAAELMGLLGLANAWKLLHDNLQALALQQQPLNNEQVSLVDSWSIYFLDYLQQLSEESLELSAIDGLIDFLSNIAWPHPLASDSHKNLRETLTTNEIFTQDDEGNSLPITADFSLLSLTLSEDINPELFEGLMLELPQQVSSFAVQIEEYIQHQNQAALVIAQRIAHTLKGSANVVGIGGLANFMHFSEDLLEEIARHQGMLTPSLKNLLTDIADTLSSILDALLSGDAIGALELSVMQQVLDAYHSIRQNGLPHETDEFLSSHHSENKIRVNEPSHVDTDAQVSAQMSPLQEAIATQLRVKEETAQELLRLAGESAIATNRVQTQVHDVKEQMLHIAQLHNKLTSLTEEFGHLIEVRELFNNPMRTKSEDGLDALELDRYNELHSFFHQLQEFATDTRDAIQQTQGQLRNLEELTFEQQVTNRESQNHLLEMRMVPANTMEARFQRCVRQSCRLTGKNARFVLQGGETMIDTRVLHELIDPLMHLLRNAVDHGIESSEQRVLSGKPAEGIVTLGFHAQGQSILIHVTDDGAGLNQQRIVNKAEALSLRAPADADEKVVDRWLKQLIFMAGFSTREEVSQTSGRGIGLDVVADRISQLKGRINVESYSSDEGNRSSGCEFTIRLPMTMISEHGLLIDCGRHNMAISARAVEQLLYAEADELINRDGKLYYYFNQKMIDVFHLAQLARLPDVDVYAPSQMNALLIVEGLAGQHVGVLIERVVASREMVIKPLSSLTPNVAGVIGATILGNGSVAPVIDVQQLLLNMLQETGKENRAWMLDALRLSEQSHDAKPMALVVDDSLSTRRSLTQFVSDMGMDVRTAKDGFEALEVIQEQVPSVILVDMEMPRMNGLELTAHVRASELISHIPIIMITSRNTEKHRNLADAAGVDVYLNKPFSEEELLHHIQNAIQTKEMHHTPNIISHYEVQSI